MSDSAQILSVQNNSQATKALGGCTGKGFLPGKSGNPGGRPKKLTRLLERELFKVDKLDPQARTYAKKLIHATIDRAIKKSDEMVKLCFDRVEGKAENSEPQSGPTVVIINGNMGGE